MDFQQRVAEDPWSTALDRCVADSYRTVAQHEFAVSMAARRRLGPALYREVCEYWNAVTENLQWNSSMRFAWQRHSRWSVPDAAWIWETDEEFERRVAQLKWKPVGDRFEFVGNDGHRESAVETKL